MQQPSTHPAILTALTIARSLGESHYKRLLASLENGSLPLSAGVLHIQHLLHVSSSTSRSIANLLRQWQTWGKDASALSIVLQTARATSHVVQAESPSVHLVWTGPISLPGPTRTTSSVMVDLIAQAQQEIIVVGYALAETARQIIEHLAQAQQRGIQIVLILNRLEEE